MKKRTGRPRGKPRKLTDAQVAEVRAWYASVMELPSAQAMADRLQIGTSLLYRVGKGVAYKTHHRADVS